MRSPRVARPAHVERPSMLRDGVVAASLRRVGSIPCVGGRSGEAAEFRRGFGEKLTFLIDLPKYPGKPLSMRVLAVSRNLIFS